MDVKNLKRLIRLVEQSEINELEIEDSGTRVKIVKNQYAFPTQVLPQAPPPPAGLPVENPGSALPAPSAPPSAEASDQEAPLKRACVPRVSSG